MRSSTHQDKHGGARKAAEGLQPGQALHQRGRRRQRAQEHRACSGGQPRVRSRRLAGQQEVEAAEPRHPCEYRELEWFCRASGADIPAPRPAAVLSAQPHVHRLKPPSLPPSLPGSPSSPSTDMRSSVLVMYSAVARPGRMPGMLAPCRLSCSLRSLGSSCGEVGWGGG